MADPSQQCNELLYVGTLPLGRAKSKLDFVTRLSSPQNQSSIVFPLGQTSSWMLC